MCMFARMHAACMWMWVRARVAFYTWKLGSTSADVRRCEKEEEKANERRSKHPHAIKILEETGRESESEAASGERVTGVGRDITDDKGAAAASSRHWDLTETMKWLMTLCMSRYMDSASGDQGSITLCRYQSASDRCITPNAEGGKKQKQKNPTGFHAFNVGLRGNAVI